MSKVEGNETYLRSRERAWGMRAGAAKDILLSSRTRKVFA